MCVGRNRSRTASGPGRRRAGEGVAEEAVSRAGFSFCPGSWGEWHSSTNSNFRACLLTFGIILLVVFPSHCSRQTQRGETVSSPAFFICSHQACSRGTNVMGKASTGHTSLRIYPVTPDLRNLGPYSVFISKQLCHRDIQLGSQEAVA